MTMKQVKLYKMLLGLEQKALTLKNSIDLLQEKLKEGKKS
jgi:hypothetical protein